MKSAEGGMSSARKGCMESRQRRVCYQSEGEGEYTLTRDAILRGAQFTSSGLCPLITCQSFGLDKKLSNPIGLLNFLEAPPGFEPMDNGVADRGLTTWLRHQKDGADYGARTRHLDLGKVALYQMS